MPEYIIVGVYLQIGETCWFYEFASVYKCNLLCWRAFSLYADWQPL